MGAISSQWYPTARHTSGLRKRVSKQYIAWLDQISENAPLQLGRKADNIAKMHRAGFLIPAGFCITTQAYQDFKAANALTKLTDKQQLAARLRQGQFPHDLREAIESAYHKLAADAVAVRSSAISEDLSTASFAGQQETYLDVQGNKDLLDAIRRCWASLYSKRALAYRQEQPLQAADESMAVVIQTMIPCEVAGVAFSRDPLINADAGVIELAPGLGSRIVDGSTEVRRFTFDRAGDYKINPRDGGLLGLDQIRQIAEAAMDLERLFGHPQDVEWGYQQGKLYLFQSRPITVSPLSFFTEAIPNDEVCWSSGFLNERFPQTLSPLGWTLIRDLIEPLGFRDPLRFMGFKPRAEMPVIKLYRGRPFINLLVFQILFKPFPNCLLPEDVGRYFPGGNTELRKEAPYPCGLLDPRFVISMMRFFAKEPANWSPFHNFNHWESFVDEHDRRMGSLQGRADALDKKTNPAIAWDIIEEAQDLAGQLLTIHRWSLLWAEIFYSVLRRSLAAWIETERANALCAQLVSGLPNKSLEINKALAGLVNESDWKAFMNTYGHRSHSLDIYQPTFMENPSQVKQVADGITGGLEDRSSQRERAEVETRRALSGQSWGRFKVWFFNIVLSYAQRYMPLRENQRFYWQKILALERRLSLWIGKYLAEKNLIKQPEDIFFITMDELRQAVTGERIPTQEIPRRRKEFAQLEQSYHAAPELNYPCFLLGNQPIGHENSRGTDILRGQPVSPGLARGPARLVTTPDQLDEISRGDILVTHGADPGWTVLFGRIAGLVTEVGGQLSHASVVAREYGLPAVAGVAGAMKQIQDGQEVIVDGLSGTVTRVKKHETDDSV